MILETAVPATGAALAPAGRIVFDDVVVRYRGRDALRLSATVEPGEIVALTGPSGCGKSTALTVLLGFVVPDAGRVTVGGVDLVTVDPAAWRKGIAWVPQQPHLFAGTVSDNIALGRDVAVMPAPPTDSVHCLTAPATGAHAPAIPAADASATVSDVVAAARRAGADGFIAALPDGYATVLGDDGAGLSAGQRQRIALARAFLRDAPIVLLDEPTANLDIAAADEVMAAIRRLARGRTVILAAHRPELVAIADRVIELAAQPVRAGAS